MVAGVAKLPRFVEMKREVEIDTRHEVINSMEGSSFPGWLISYILYLI